MGEEVSANVHAIPVAEVEKKLRAAEKLTLRLGENLPEDGSVIVIRELKNAFGRPTLDLKACQLAPATTATLFRKFADGYAECQLRGWQEEGMEDVELGQGDRLVVGFRQKDKKAVLLELV